MPTIEVDTLDEVTLKQRIREELVIPGDDSGFEQVYSYVSYAISNVIEKVLECKIKDIINKNRANGKENKFLPNGKLPAGKRFVIKFEVKELKVDTKR